MAILNDSIVQGDLRVVGKLYAEMEGKTTSADYATNLTNTAIKVSSAITAQTALHLTTNVADNYTALSAGSAKNAGTAQTARNGVFYEKTFGGLPATYSTTIAYAAGDLVLTGGYVYSASQEIEAGAWKTNSAKFAKINQVTWTVTDSSITALYEGLTIIAKIPSYGGSSASNATMLNINNLGAKQVRINNSNYTTHFAPSTLINMTYDGTYWQIGDRDTDSNNYVRQYNNATSNYRPLLMGYSNNTNPASLTADVTNIAYVNSGLYVKPSDGSLYSKGIISAGVTFISPSANITTMSATTGYALTASGNSAKFTNISATNITGNLTAASVQINGDITANTINANEAVINGDTRILGAAYADTLQVNKTALIGEGLTADPKADYQLVIGNYNVPVASAAFIIGNGSVNNRANSMFIYKNGDIYINSLRTYLSDRTLLICSDVNGKLSNSHTDINTLYLATQTEWWAKSTYDASAGEWSGSFSTVGTHYLIPTNTAQYQIALSTLTPYFNYTFYLNSTISKTFIIANNTNNDMNIYVNCGTYDIISPYTNYTAYNSDKRAMLTLCYIASANKVLIHTNV